jgi:hypothetical protein
MAAPRHLTSNGSARVGVRGVEDDGAERGDADAGAGCGQLFRSALN